METLLFQGDSVTDSVRNRDNDKHLGQGYVTMVAGNLGVKYPDRFNFLNRGIGGDRSVDLLARWKKDCLNLRPDYLSMLIGVNDVSHELAYQNGVSRNVFKNVYHILLDTAFEMNNNLKVILMTPFIMHGELTDCYYKPFKEELLKREMDIIEFSKEYNIPYINLRELMEKECMPYASDSNWSIDGLHPTSAGHSIIAKKFLEEFEKIL